MLKLGNLSVTVHRTVRVEDGRAPAALPPSLGRAVLHKVSDHRATCPETWEDDGVFVGLHDKEAIWLSFGSTQPIALVVGAGGVNALTGKPLSPALEKGGYMVAPPQPWLDGWKSDDGSVYQFVSALYESGTGNTVGEQLLGKDSKSGGLGIAVFDSKESLQALPVPSHAPVGGYGYGGMETLSFGEGAKGAMRGAPMTEMGLGRGGKIIQKIYPDPHGLSVWKEEASATAAIYLVNAESFHEITGEELSPEPVSATSYTGPMFEVKDEKLGDVDGSGAFTGLKSVFET